MPEGTFNTMLERLRAPKILRSTARGVVQFTVIEVKPAPVSNALVRMLVTDTGILIEVILTHPSSVFALMLVNEFESVIEVKPVQN